MVTIMARDGAMTDRPAALPRRARSRGGPDRLTVMLLVLAGFLVVLAILATRLRTAPAQASVPAPRVVVLRRIYRTTVVDDGLATGRGATATVSVSVSGATPPTTSGPAPTTRTSAHP
jgi:hypothetical protein